jgi:hypothetical protein
MRGVGLLWLQVREPVCSKPRFEVIFFLLSTSLDHRQSGTIEHILSLIDRLQTWLNNSSESFSMVVMRFVTDAHLRSKLPKSKLSLMLFQNRSEISE